MFFKYVKKIIYTRSIIDVKELWDLETSERKILRKLLELDCWWKTEIEENNEENRKNYRIDEKETGPVLWSSSQDEPGKTKAKYPDTYWGVKTIPDDTLS